MKKIVLASKSPRRKELFEKLGLKFTAVDSEYEEDLDKKLKPATLARFLSQGKAKAVAKKYKDALIIAADTFIVFQNRILGKPRSPKNACQMLSEMSGKSHGVITGFTIIDTKTSKTISQAIETKVYFRKLTSQEIANYVKTKQPLDKAGAYGIQDLGQLLIKKIEGDYSNVVGLPLAALTQGLKQFGINIL